MTYDEFVDRYEGTRPRLATCSVVMLAFFALSTSLIFFRDRAGQHGQLLVAVLLVLGILTWQWADRVRWRRGGLRCGVCAKWLDPNSAAGVFDTNVCPHCHRAAFEVREPVGEFVDVDPAELKARQKAAGETAVDTPNDDGNPYAAPQSSQAAGFSVSPLALPGRYLVSVLKSLLGVVASERRVIAEIDRELVAMTGMQLDPNCAMHQVAAYRRTSLLWLLCGLALPVAPASLVAMQLSFEHVLEWIILAATLIGSLMAGGFAYIVLVSYGPLKKWAGGGQPALKAKTDEETGFRGFHLFFFDQQAYQSRRPHLTLRYRVSAPTSVSVGLVNSEMNRAFRVALPCHPSSGWTTGRVNFQVLLGHLDSDFTGDCIRIAIPETIDFDLDGFIATFPEATAPLKSPAPAGTGSA